MKTQNRYKNLVLSICLISLSLSIPLIAQENENEAIISKPSDGAFCELNKVFLEKLFLEQRKNNEKLFVVSTLGRKEKPTLRHARIFNSNVFLIQVMNFDKDDALFTENIDLKKAGVLEFYLGSKLFLGIEQPFNKISCFTCCEEYVPKKAKRRIKTVSNRKRK